MYFCINDVLNLALRPKKNVIDQALHGNIKTELLFANGRIIHEASLFFPPNVL